MYKQNPILCENSNRVSLSLLYFGYAKVGSNWKGSHPGLDFSLLYYIVSGSAEIYSDEQVFTLEAGNWYLIPAGMPFRYNCQDHMEHIYFHLKLCGLDRMDLLRIFGVPCKLKPQEDMSGFLMDSMESRDITDSIKIKNIVYSMLLSFIEENDIKIKSYDYSPCVSAALLYINQNLSVRLTVSEIAENTFVSKSTLEKFFKKEVHTSVHNYINDMVMFEASRLLSGTKLSVLEISEKLRFCDQFYFSKRFKNKFDMTPRQYRKSQII